MATTIETPNITTHMSAYNCIPFKITMDDAGTAPIVKSGYYEIENVTDSITLTRVILPYNANGYNFDGRVQIQRHLETMKPVIDSATTTFDTTTGSKLFRILYGEISFNSDTCDTTITQNGFTGSFRVVNSNFKYYTTNPLSAVTGPVVLSSKPERNYTCPSGNDWIYLYSYNYLLSYSVYAVVNYKDGTSFLGPYENRSPNTIAAVPVGLGNGYFMSDVVNDGKTVNDVKSYEIRIYNTTQTGTPPILPLGTLLKSYLYTIDDCCGDGDMNTLIWLEPEGGYSGLEFSTIESLGAQKTTRNFLLAKDCETVLTSTPGRTGLMGAGESNIKLTLSRVIRWGKEAKYYIMGMLSSNTHFLKIKTHDDTYRMVRFNIDASDYQFFNSDEEVIINITGTLNLQIDAQEGE